MVYDKIDGNYDRSVVFIVLDDNGEIFSSTISKDPIMTDKTGHTFIVDDYVAEQISKFKVINGKLELIDGEQIDEPVKSDTDLQEEELLRQLEALRAQKNNE